MQTALLTHNKNRRLSLSLSLSHTIKPQRDGLKKRKNVYGYHLTEEIWTSLRYYKTIRFQKLLLEKFPLYKHVSWCIMGHGDTHGFVMVYTHRVHPNVWICSLRGAQITICPPQQPRPSGLREDAGLIFY